MAISTFLGLLALTMSLAESHLATISEVHGGCCTSRDPDAYDGGAGLAETPITVDTAAAPA